MLQKCGMMCDQSQAKELRQMAEGSDSPSEQALELYEGECVEAWLPTCRCTSVSLDLDLEGSMCLTSYRIWFRPFAVVERRSQLRRSEKAVMVPNLCVSGYALPTESAFQTFPFVAGMSSSSGPRIGYSIKVCTKDVRRFEFVFCTLEGREKLVRHIKSRSFFTRHQLNPPIFCYSLGEGRKLSTLPNGRAWKYDPSDEYERLDKSTSWSEWFELIENKADGRPYGVCETYPSRFVVPKATSVEELMMSCKFRSSERAPATVWIHPRNRATLSRSAQPLSGVCRSNEGDERLVKAIWEANPVYARNRSDKCSRRPERRALSLRRRDVEVRAPGGDEVVVDGVASSGEEESVGEQEESSRARMRIIDARSLTAAIANIVKGGGYENVHRYGDECQIEFLNIHNIHKVRNSFDSLCRFLLLSPATLDASSVKSLPWLQHVRSILNGALAIAGRLESQSSVLVHCSDGWDRTSQLVSLAELLLDPYFRTLRGFCNLVQKEWLAFGHRFALRFGIGQIESEDGECSPVFIQWLDAVYQCICQCPEAFEFTPVFLVWLLDAAQSGRYGTFLFDSEKQREEMGGNLPCVWTYLAEREHTWQSSGEGDVVWRTWINPSYDRDRQDGIGLRVSASRLQLWEAYFYRYCDRAASFGEPGVRAAECRGDDSASSELTVVANGDVQPHCLDLMRRLDSLPRHLERRADRGSLWKHVCLPARRRDLDVVSRLVEIADEYAVRLWIRDVRCGDSVVDDCDRRICIQAAGGAASGEARETRDAVVHAADSRWWETIRDWGSHWSSYLKDTASAAVVYAIRK